MVNNSRTSASSIFLTTVLYILQGMNLGLTGSIPLFLIYYGATWEDRGTFNFSFYPFSLKLIWAPLIDVLYIKRFGRRKSWLIPIQLITAVILLVLSFYIQSWIVSNRVILLTIVFFIIIFLTATEDICVDGLAISLFSATNPQWASTSQTIGQTFGRFVGSSFLMTFESANFTNKFIRQPLSLPSQTSGFFTLAQFTRFVAVAFLVVLILLIAFVREKEEVSTVNGEETEDLSLIKTYLSIVKLFKKKCIRQVTLVSLLSPIGFVATGSMTSLALIGQGVPRATLALVSIPVTLITIIAPLIIRRTERPLIWFGKSYVLLLISEIPVAIYVYFTPHMISSGYYYPVLILLFALNEFISTLRFTALVGFFASISDPRIGGTYMTFLVTLSNLGFALNSSVVLYVANWLPKRYAYIIAVGSCLLLGIIWFVFSFRTLIRLQNLPTEKWYLPQKKVTADDATTSKEQGQDDHQFSLIPDKGIDQIT